MQWLADCRPVDLERRLSSIVLIIFNYDRCIEHYIYHWLKSYYGLKPAAAANLLSMIEIYHPYGTVGPLLSLGADDGIGFGSIPHPSNIPPLAGKIKTFTEGTDEKSSDIVAIRHHMGTALRLVFLGFAFHQMNMDLLQSGPPVRNRKVFATCRGLARSKTEMISGGFSMSGPFIGDSGIHFCNVACNQLFQEFSHYFSPE